MKVGQPLEGHTVTFDLDTVGRSALCLQATVTLNSRVVNFSCYQNVFTAKRSQLSVLT